MIALEINFLAMIVILWAAYVFWDINLLDANVIAKFKTRNPSFFYGWGQFYRFLTYSILKDVLFEEAWARGPVWLLINSKIKNRTLFSSIALIVLGGLWAKTHVFLWPVYIIGMIWGVAVIRTRSLWPAFVCHSAANLFIYFSVKLLRYFQFIT